MPTSLGFASFLGHEAVTQNSVLVDIILETGAIVYVKTNMPQTRPTDSHNNVFGRVQNPHRNTLTACGSSGDEAVLVAMRGSIVGLGTDIAGSIRIPSLCCGIKSSVGRVPYAGQTSARHVRDCFSRRTNLPLYSRRGYASPFRFE